MQAHLLASYTPGVTVDRMPVAYVLLHLLCSSTHVSLTSGQQILSHCCTFAARCLEDIHTQKRLLLFEGIVALQLTCTHARMHTRTQARTHARTNTHTHTSVCCITTNMIDTKLHGAIKCITTLTLTDCQDLRLCSRLLCDQQGRRQCGLAVQALSIFI